MKKWLAGFFLLVILAILSVYIFIPKQLNISAVKIMKANTNSLYRYISDDARWAKWWPAKNGEQLIKQNNYYSLNNFNYRLAAKLYNAVVVETISNEQAINGKIMIIQLSQDSLAVQWENSLTTSSNPFTKLLQYSQAVSIKKNMTVILDSLKSFSEDKDKVYKFHIHNTTLENTFYVSAKTVTTGYPKTAVVYKLIENLRTYIAAEKAAEVDFPIFNTATIDSLHYETMVAIPVNKTLSGNGNIAIKRMIIYKDKIVMAEVQGGSEKINEAYDELNTYLKDYNLATPVIYWETLVTDRSKETDSTKWITRICVPIA